MPPEVMREVMNRPTAAPPQRNLERVVGKKEELSRNAESSLDNPTYEEILEAMEQTENELRDSSALDDIEVEAKEIDTVSQEGASAE